MLVSHHSGLCAAFVTFLANQCKQRKLLHLKIPTIWHIISIHVHAHGQIDQLAKKLNSLFAFFQRKQAAQYRIFYLREAHPENVDLLVNLAI